VPAIDLLLYSLIVLPLLGIVPGLFIRLRRSWYPVYSSIFAGLTFLATAAVFIQTLQNPELVFLKSVTWLKLDSFSLDFGLMADPVGAMMLLVVGLVAFLVQVFSLGYMKEDERIASFFLNLQFFALVMILLVLSSNLFQTFIFWELVGFASWSLIGFWYSKPSPSKAAQKAFLVNRIGDAGFVMAMGALVFLFGSLSYSGILSRMDSVLAYPDIWLVVASGGDYPVYKLLDGSLMQWVGAGLLLAVMAKSAQYPLAIWLPDAMEGPTPVSALIHAATMVAAGVFLIVRYYFLFTPEVLDAMLIIGAITAFMGAVAGFAQYDIKRVLAFSTVSQLGLMLAGLGAGAWAGGFLHLVTHAFFKAGLFLTAGAIIHFVAHHKDISDPQDIRYMGGLARKVPFLAVIFTLCMAALMGLPFFSGFLSKEAILSGILLRLNAEDSLLVAAVYLVLITLALTVLYMMRLFIYIFLGKAEAWEGISSKQPLVFVLPLGVLAVLSLGFWITPGLDFNSSDFMAFIGNPAQSIYDLPGGLSIDDFTNASEKLHSSLSLLSLSIVFSAMILGAIWFGFLHRRVIQLPLLSAISANNWYMDTLCEFLILKPVMLISRLIELFDQHVLDRIVRLSAEVTVVLSALIAWLDKWVIDGIVKAVAYLSKVLGSISGTGKQAAIQGSLMLAVGFFLLMVYWLLLN
jgi:NADH-quinone oxidoreductase subunit L